GAADGQITAPGEFIIGLPEQPHPADAQSNVGPGPSWATNGSYLVFRRFRQNVAGFQAAMDAQAASLTSQGVPMTGTDLAARMIGRTQDGLALKPEFAADPL